MFDAIIIGGGAAGIFGALAVKENDPHAIVVVLEKTAQLLSKVRISGGGRCNVTHACFDPKELVKNYPRGFKELIGPFTRFQPRDTVQWFSDHGVELKTEADGRMFPVTDDSETIIECLLSFAKKLGVDIRTQQKIRSIEKNDDQFVITLETEEKLLCKNLLLTSGSSPQGHAYAKAFGHTIQPLVPSLFTFNVPESPFKDLQGSSVEYVTIDLLESSFSQSGPLLFTHWGFSGPAALKLSSWGARFLNERNYKTKLRIDMLPRISAEQFIADLIKLRKESSSQSVGNNYPEGITKNLWKKLLEISQIDSTKKMSEISNDSIKGLCNTTKAGIYLIDGKTTYKEEFVTCGGVTRSEVDFKTMESKLCPGLFFAGEILDVDAVTGGFNFQNAWTTSWIVAQTIGKRASMNTL